MHVGIVLCWKELSPRKREPWVLIQAIHSLCDLGQMPHLSCGIHFSGKFPSLSHEDTVKNHCAVIGICVGICICKYTHTIKYITFKILAIHP